MPVGVRPPFVTQRALSAWRTLPLLRPALSIAWSSGRCGRWPLPDEDDVQQRVCRRVRDALTVDTEVVVAHSLGSVALITVVRVSALIEALHKKADEDRRAQRINELESERRRLRRDIKRLKGELFVVSAERERIATELAEVNYRLVEFERLTLWGR